MKRFCKQFHYLVDHQASQNMQVEDAGDGYRRIQISLQTPMIGERRALILRLSRAMAIELADLLIECAESIPKPEDNVEYDGYVLD